MTEERFEIFLEDYNKDKKVSKSMQPLQPFVFKFDNVFVGGMYYKESDKNNYFITLKNNAYKEHIKAVVKQENINDDELLKTTFSLVEYEGVSLNTLYTKRGVLAEYRVILFKIEKSKKGKIKIVNIKDDILILKSKYMYRNMKECAEEFEMVKPFINSLANKYTNRKLANVKNVCLELGENEQVFLSCKSKKEGICKTILDGYFYSSIENIIVCLSSLPELQAQTWNCDEVLRNPDGTEA